MNREVVRDGETGFLAGDAAAWTGVLRKLIRDPARSTRIGEVRREAVAAHDGLPRMTERLAEELTRLPELSRNSAR
jgi:glycosyltransferase involved in cell wall biosynthesis